VIRSLEDQLGGPLTVDAHAQFMQNDAWTVHTSYHVEMLYPKKVQVVLDNKNPNGIRFEGDEGWVFCTRSAEEFTGADSNTTVLRPLFASDPKILSPLDEHAVRWMPSKSHHGNWLESILANKQPIAPIQQSARSLEACAAAWIGMKLRKLLDFPEPLGDFMAFVPGSRKQQTYPSTVSYLARLILHRYEMLGLLDADGAPRQQMGILETPSEKASPVIAGARCPECANTTLIRKDGCDYCTACGYVGVCG